jgi:hypothetical protein
MHFMKQIDSLPSSNISNTCHTFSPSEILENSSSLILNANVKSFSWYNVAYGCQWDPYNKRSQNEFISVSEKRKGVKALTTIQISFNFGHL